MPLDDAAIERYSRHLVLPEIGPRGQARLAAARVAVTGGGPAAERVVAYLAAAGVGTLAIPPDLRAFVDPDQPDIHIEPLPAAPAMHFDAAVIASGAFDAPALVATHTLWVADGRAAALPPCVECTLAALGPPPPAPITLAAVRDAVLGTIAATEVVKALLEFGVALRGRVLVYDPTTASIDAHPIAARATCARCRGAVA